MAGSFGKKVVKFLSFLVLAGAVCALSYYLGIKGILISLIIIFAAVLIGYGADMLEMVLPGGVAIAIVALLQISPEFFVEWATVKRAALEPLFMTKIDILYYPFMLYRVVPFEPSFTHNAMANLYGANKLLVGFGPPLVFFVYYFFSHTRKENYIEFHKIKSYSIFVMLFAILYNFIMYLKNSLMWYDSIFLIIIYIISVVYIGKMEIKYEKTHSSETADKENEENESFFMRFLKRISKNKAGIVIAFNVYAIAFAFLVFGGGLLVHYSETFLEVLLEASVLAGIPTFFFIGYVAPFMSEFPEKLVAIGFAMKGEEDTAMINFLSSILSQLTLLTAMVPLVYSFYRGELTGIVFDHVQSQELLLVVAMVLFSLMMFFDLKFTIRETIMALGLFLWQFMFPDSRELITKIYFVLFLSYVLEFFLENRHKEMWQVVSAKVEEPKDK